MHWPFMAKKSVYLEELSFDEPGSAALRLSLDSGYEPNALVLLNELRERTFYKFIPSSRDASSEQTCGSPPCAARA